VLGAWLATLRPDRAPEALGPAAEPAAPPAPPAAAEQEEPQEKAPDRAPAGSLPPQTFVAAKRCPDLLEVDGESYFPVRLLDFDTRRFEAVGADGKLYTIASGRVTKVMDRVDLARRAAQKSAGLAPGDADGRLALADWCVRRFVQAEARRLVEQVLELRPNDEAARTLLSRLEEGE
jgi:hypothetical protein